MASQPARALVASIREWQMWTLPPTAIACVVAVVILDLALTSAALATSTAAVSLPHLGLYLALLGCGAVAIEATKNIMEIRGTGARDLLGAWFLPAALLFPPGLALLAPLLVNAYRAVRVPVVFPYRRVFSAATVSLAYGAASAAFHAAPASIAGPTPLSGGHAATGHATTWLLLAAACSLLAWLINNSLVLAAIHLATPEVQLFDALGGRTALISDVVEQSISVTVALVTATVPVALVLALPLIVYSQRYLMDAQLVDHSRVDAQSGTLTGVIWRYEADVVAYNAQRTRRPLAVVLAEIDKFSSIAEDAGPDAAGTVLRAVATILTEKLPPAAQIGRLKGGEFAIVLPGVGEDEARRRAERIRDHIFAESVAIESDDQLEFILGPTISVGVAGQTGYRRDMTELIARADTALARARDNGGNQVRVAA